MLEEAIKLLERVLETKSMNGMADLEDDITIYLQKYYDNENLEE